jgi:hypothetical protein
MEEMWWSADEEDLQQQAQAAWGMFPLEDIADPAGDMADLADDMADPMVNPADLEEDNGDIPAFQWHIPEGDPVPEARPPLVNGFHPGLPVLNGFHGGDDLEDGFIVAMHGPWAVFDPPDNFPG